MKRAKLYWYQRQLRKIDERIQREEDYLKWNLVECETSKAVLARLKKEWLVVAEKINKIEGF